MSKRSRVGTVNALGRLPALALVALLLTLGWWLQETRPDGPGVLPPPTTGAVDPPALAHAGLPAFLPPEAQVTLALIERNGPFRHPQDDGVFGNREGHLPKRARGFYREYTVETPGLGHRGARRIVTGGTPPRVYYYTDDHYDSFRRFEPMP